MTMLGQLAVPLVVAGIVLFGAVRGVRVFEVFVEGAKEGLKTSANILPSLVALTVAVGMFKASGGLDVITYALEPLGKLIGLPREILPLSLMRPVSGSGAMVIFNDLIVTYGPDSYVGRIGSVLLGSTETTFYTMALYYGAVGIKDTRHTVPCALLGDFMTSLMAALTINLFFGVA